MRLSVRDAIIFSILLDKVEESRRKGKNCYEGRYWVINIQNAITEAAPFIGVRTVKRSVEKLVVLRYIERIMFPNNPVGARWWFTIGERGERLMKECGFRSTRGRKKRKGQ